MDFRLDDYDGALAYGAVITGFMPRPRAFGPTASEVRVFHPLPSIERVDDLVWIGNWGDEERTNELRRFLIEPATDLELRCRVYGVRFPREAVDEIHRAGLEYCGWLPNYRVPETFARARVTLHIPRAPYVQYLPGIPTIRVFEALACGIPLICSPWADTENLFRSGHDHLLAHNGDEMRKYLRDVLHDPSWRNSLQ